MNSLKTVRNPIPGMEVYKDFMRLSREHRRHLALRILRNERLLADLYDHFLIQRSLEEPGTNPIGDPVTQQSRKNCR